MTDDAMWVPGVVALWNTFVESIDDRWRATLAANLATAAVEELRVRAAEKRVRDHYGAALGAARRLVPIGGRR